MQRGLSILQKDFGVQRGAKAWYKCWGGISTTIFVVRFPSYKSVQQELVSSVLRVLKLCTDSSGQEVEKNLSLTFPLVFQSTSLCAIKNTMLALLHLEGD